MTFEAQWIKIYEKRNDIAGNEGASDAVTAGDEPVTVRNGHGGETGEGEETFLPHEGVQDEIVINEPVAEETWQRSVVSVEHGDEGDGVDGETEQDIEEDQVGHENVAAPAQRRVRGDGHEADGVEDDG